LFLKQYPPNQLTQAVPEDIRGIFSQRYPK
jgi:hypothetical protein